MAVKGEKAASPVRRIMTLDRTVHEPARLAVLLLLSAVDEADFLYILDETGMSKGNLSSHVAKLEDAGLVSVEKVFLEKIPRTIYRLTEKGAESIAAHSEVLLNALSEMAAITRAAAD